MRRTAGMLICWLAMQLTGCAPMEPQSDSSDVAPLVPSLQVFPTSEGLRFVLQVTNAAEGPIDLSFRSGQTYDFLVRQGDRQVWRWSDEHMFTQALRQERLEGGETWGFEATWRPQPGEEGEFVVVGMLTSSDHPLEESAAITAP